jgi:hypothetical protein
VKLREFLPVPASQTKPMSHPAQFRWLILAAALVAMATWWGLGLP